MTEAVENKTWWKKQRTWAMVLGLVSTVLGFIPAVQVAAAPMMAVAVLLGYKGMADSQARVETTTAKTAVIAAKTEHVVESSSGKLDVVAAK